MNSLKTKIHQQELKINAKKALIHQSSQSLNLLAAFSVGLILGYRMSAKVSSFKRSKAPTTSFLPSLIKSIFTVRNYLIDFN